MTTTTGELTINCETCPIYNASQFPQIGHVDGRLGLCRRTGR